MSRLVYVFGLVERKAAAFTLAGHRVQFAKADTLFAAVERIDERPAVSEAALRAQHDIVSRLAEKVDAVLPARFGSLVEIEELERVVALRRDAIREALALVRGRVQMTVRIFDAAARPEPAPLVPAAAGATSGTEYLHARRQAARPPAIAAITAAVKDIVAAERAEPGQGRIAATIYHLVDRGTVNTYAQRLEAIAPEPNKELSVSGPWPPFAFVPELWP